MRSGAAGGFLKFLPFDILTSPISVPITDLSSDVGLSALLCGRDTINLGFRLPGFRRLRSGCALARLGFTLGCYPEPKGPGFSGPDGPDLWIAA